MASGYRPAGSTGVSSEAHLSADLTDDQRKAAEAFADWLTSPADEPLCPERFRWQRQDIPVDAPAAAGGRAVCVGPSSRQPTKR